MDKENNIVYVQTKKGIFKCYKSEQMHKPIYYPIESKTNGYIDYYDVIRILNIDDLYKQVKKQKEVIDNAIEYITSYESISTIQGLTYIEANKQLDEKTMTEMTNRYLLVHDKLLEILQDKEVSK